jgi:hypothetical protein
VDLGAWSRGMNQPNYTLEGLGCTKRLWVSYDLAYVGTAADGIQDELARNGRKCKGFMAYRPGYSPKEHKEMQIEHWRSRRNLIMTVLAGGAGGAIASFLNWVLAKFL